MNKISCLRALTLGSLLLSAPVFADSATIQHYWVRIPQTADCGQAASDLGTAFAQATKLQVLQSICASNAQINADGTTYTMFGIDVAYTAKVAADIQTTAFGIDTLGLTVGDSTGAYATMKSCLNDLNRQAAVFEEQTGLAALAPRCEPGADDNVTSYTLKIDSFGTMTQTLKFVDISDFTAAHDATNIALAKDVTDLVSNSGGTIALDMSGRVYYFSATDFPIHVDHLDTYNVQNECYSQLDAARAMYAAAGATSASVECVPTLPGADASDPSVGLTMIAIHNLPSSLFGDYGSTSTRYYSFDECEANKDRVIQNIVQTDGYTPIGALCVESGSALSSDDYALEFYRE